MNPDHWLLFRQRPAGDTLGKRMRRLVVDGDAVQTREVTGGWECEAASMDQVRALEPLGFVVRLAPPEPEEPAITRQRALARDLEVYGQGWPTWLGWLADQEIPDDTVKPLNLKAALKVQRTRAVRSAGRPTKTAKSLAIVLVVTGRDEKADRAVCEIARELGGAQVVVVDNGAPSGAVSHTKFDGIERTYVTVENRGFGTACDAALPLLRKGVRHVLFTQSDAVFDAAAVLEALALSKANGDALVGPSGGVLLEHSACVSIVREVGANIGARDGVPCAADWIAGYWLLAPQKALKAAGGWGDEYFLYFEDPDLSLRCAAHGHRSIVAPELGVKHARMATISTLFSHAGRETIRAWSRATFKRRWGVPLGQSR